MKRPLIVVFGATGRQGGAVARALLAQGRWQVRAVTRHTGSEAARALADAGAALCPADLDAPATLAAALQGAHAVFGVTNYWEHGDAQRELRQATGLAAAIAATCPTAHRIWSTLEDSRPVLRPPTGQRYAVPHLDAKAEANAAFLAGDAPVTLLLTSFFWENLIDFGMGPRRAGDGVLELALPLGAAPLPGLAVADIGPVVAALLEQPPAQCRFGIAGEHPGGARMAAVLAEVLGEPVRYVDVPLPIYAGLPFPGAAELAAMFEYKQRASAAYVAARPVEASRALHPGLRDFRHWALQHRAALRAAIPPLAAAAA
ncbi:MAG: NmrA family NAD(P)-binding protein [Aquabacterium sp.]